MTLRPLRLGSFEHVVGAASAATLMKWSSEIGTMVSISLCLFLERTTGEARLYFLDGVDGPRWTPWAALLVLGFVVATADWLVSSGRMRAWVPPAGMLAVVTGVFLFLFRVGGTDPNEAAVLSLTLGALAVLALSAYWGGALLAHLLRSRFTITPRHAGQQ